MELVEKAILHFLETFETGDPSIRLYDKLPRHVSILEKWAKHLVKKFPEANKEILLMSVWLHDIGQLDGDRDEDHAVRSEREVLKFLPSIGADEELTKKVAHCVRAHRCKDVQPTTIEAKILAAADSASHFTDIVYVDMMESTNKEQVLAKLERDYRDVALLPGLLDEIEHLYNSWKNLIEQYPDWVLTE